MKNFYWKELDKNSRREEIGTWQFFSYYSHGNSAHKWLKIFIKLIRKFILESIESSVHFFDTNYELGFSKEILRVTIKEIRNDDFVIFSKSSLSKKALLTKSLDTGFQEQSFTFFKRYRLHILLLHSSPNELDYTNFIFLSKRHSYLGAYGVITVTMNGVQNVIKSKFGNYIPWFFNSLEWCSINEIFPLINQYLNFIVRSYFNIGFLNKQNYNKTIAYLKNLFGSTFIPSWVNLTNINSIEIIMILKEKKSLSFFIIEFSRFFNNISYINKLRYL